MRFYCLLLTLLIGVVSCDNYQQSLPAPYRDAKILSFDDHGWLSYPNELKKVVKGTVDNGGKVFVELGSWLGKSTRYIASVLPDMAKLYAVDTWVGTLNEIEHMNDPRQSMLYEIFLSNMIQSKLAHRVVPIRTTTNEAAEKFHQKIDFIFIDADHEYHAVYTDIMKWYPKLSENGVMCGDDWAWDSVRQAVIDAAKELNVKISLPAGNFWVFDRN